MKTKHLFLILTAMMLLGTVTPAQAQDWAASLTFEKPEALILAKGKKDVKIRKSPSASAAQVGVLGSAVVRDPSTQLSPILGATSHNNSWWKVESMYTHENNWQMQVPKTGYVSKSTAQLAPQAPITNDMLFPHIFGYCYWLPDDVGYEEAWWTVVDGIGSQKLALLYMDGSLWLGKRIDNVFVFKYVINFLCEVVEGTNIFKAKNVQDGEYKRLEVVLSKDKCVKAINGRNEYIINLKLFNDKTLKTIFGEVVKNGDVHWNYVTADYLSKKYVVKEWLVY
jgi:hypothetical protein